MWTSEKIFGTKILPAVISKKTFGQGGGGGGPTTAPSPAEPQSTITIFCFTIPLGADPKDSIFLSTSMPRKIRKIAKKNPVLIFF